MNSRLVCARPGLGPHFCLPSAGFRLSQFVGENNMYFSQTNLCTHTVVAALHSVLMTASASEGQRLRYASQPQTPGLSQLWKSTFRQPLTACLATSGRTSTNNPSSLRANISSMGRVNKPRDAARASSTTDKSNSSRSARVGRKMNVLVGSMAFFLQDRVPVTFVITERYLHSDPTFHVYDSNVRPP